MADDYAGDTTTTGVLPLGGIVSGNLETVDDTDWFRLDLAVGHGYLFNPVMQNGKIPTITIWQAGNPISVYTTAPDNFSSDVLANPFVPWQQGTYYLEVSGAQAGGYTVGMREAPDDFPNDTASALALTTAAPVAARFDYAFDKDLFRIAATAGMTYTVTISTDSGDLGSAEFLRLGPQGGNGGATIGGATTSYSFTAYSGGDYIVTAEMASHYPPAPSGLAYHMTLSAVDRTGPQAISGEGAVDGAIQVTFNEALVPGKAGYIELQNESNDVVDRWNAGDARIHVAGNVLTLDPGHAHILAAGNYTLKTSGGVLADASGNATGWSDRGIIHIDKTVGGGLAVNGTVSFGNLVGSASTEDVAIYPFRQSSYKITRTADGFEVRSNGDWFSFDKLTGIERIAFQGDANVVALSLDGHLGQAFRLYTAAFDRVPDQTGLGFWLHMADNGVSLNAMARGFIDSQEFTGLYGAHPGDSAFVAALYQNVLHREGEAGGVNFWMGALAKGVDRAEVLAAFSESAENVDQVAQLIGNGIVYTPYG